MRKSRSKVAKVQHKQTELEKMLYDCRLFCLVNKLSWEQATAESSSLLDKLLRTMEQIGDHNHDAMGTRPPDGYHAKS